MKLQKEACRVSLCNASQALLGILAFILRVVGSHCKPRYCWNKISFEICTLTVENEIQEANKNMGRFITGLIVLLLGIGCPDSRMQRQEWWSQYRDAEAFWRDLSLYPAPNNHTIVAVSSLSHNTDIKVLSLFTGAQLLQEGPHTVLSSGTLRIDHAAHHDEGQYECQAVSPLGVKKASVQLTVKPKGNVCHDWVYTPEDSASLCVFYTFSGTLLSIFYFIRSKKLQI